MSEPRPRWTAGAARVVAATLSGGAALVSILNYTSSAGIAVPGVVPRELRAYSITLGPALDTANALGDTIQLAAVVTDSSGTVMVGIVPVWTSGDPAVARVSRAGTVIAESEGATAIVVRVGQVEARARIVVRQVSASLQVDDTLVRVPENERMPLSARVLDKRGNPIVGADVTWATPDPAIATIEGAEVVGIRPGRTSLTAMAGPLQAALAVEVVPVPGSITVLAGDGQRGPAGRPLPAPVSAQIVSRTGRPMTGVSVAFHSVAPGASAKPALGISDARGMVRTVWRLGDLPGRQQLTIAVDGVSTTPALAAEADPVPVNTKVELLNGALTGQVGDTIAEAVAIRVTDSLGVALADVPVSWSVLDGGSVTALSGRTDSVGEARAVWKLGAKNGRQRVRAQVGNARSMPAFTAVAAANPGPAVSVVVKSGDRQLGAAGAKLERPVVLRTVDRYGNAVAGAAITLAPVMGWLADSSVTSDSTGQVTLLWTLGRTAGLQRMAMRLAGDTTANEVTALARAGKPAKLAFVSPPQSAKPGRPLPKPLVVQVTDAYDNPLGGQTVLFKPSSGIVTPARGLTGADGRATVRWTPGPGSGKRELEGAVTGSDVRRTLVLSARP